MRLIRHEQAFEAVTSRTSFARRTLLAGLYVKCVSVVHSIPVDGIGFLRTHGPMKSWKRQVWSTPWLSCAKHVDNLLQPIKGLKELY